MIYLRVALLVPVVTALLARLLNHLLAWAYLHRAEQHASPAADGASVSVVVPVRGLDQTAAENFRSLYRQVSHYPYEIIFAVEEPQDPAVPLIQELIAATPAVHSRLVYSRAAVTTAAGKLRNLIAGMAASRHEVICFVDSDVTVPPTLVEDVARAMAAPQVGLAFAVPVAVGAEDWVAALHNLTVNGSALHYLATAYHNRLTAAVGSIMVTRREVLAQIGGLEQLAERIVGIDISLGQAVHHAGFQIQLLQQPARTQHTHDDLASLWWQVHRWLVTIRRYYPAFPIVALFTALPLTRTLLFLAVSWRRQQRRTGLGLALVVGCSHIASALAINQQLVRDQRAWRHAWLAAPGELLWLAIFLHSLGGDTVYWRGRRLRVRPDLRADYVDG